MKKRTQAERTAREIGYLTKFVPQLFCGECRPLHILYVGGEPNHMLNAHELKEFGHRLTLLEIVPEWANELKRLGVFEAVKVGDVRNVNRMRFLEPFDAIYWRHGPEHLPPNDVVPTIKRLERIAKHFIIIQCPSGPTPWVKPDLEHPSLTHRSVVEESIFWKLGYRVDFIPAGSGKTRGDGAQIVGWKWNSLL